MIRQKNATRVKARASCQTAFVKQYEVPADYSFPKDFNLSKNSILFAESIRGIHGVLLFLYWSSAERARDLEPKVMKDLGLSTGGAVGSILEIVIPQKPKWLENPVRLGQSIVAVAAILGALSLIQAHFTYLFGNPHVVIFATDKAAINYHAGDPVDIPMQVRNQATSGQVDVHVDGLQLIPSNLSAPLVRLQSDVSELPQIQPGQNTEIHLSGTAPAIPYSKLQHYTVAVQATADEGRIWPNAKVNSVPFGITLWPTHMDKFKITRVAANVVQVEIKVGSGTVLAKGLRGELKLISTAAPESGGIILIGATQTRDAIISPGPFGYTVKVQFQTGQLDAFRTIPVTVVLKFQGPLTDTQLKQLQASAKVVVA